MESLVYWKGEIVKSDTLGITAGDRGFLYGYGLFETILILQGKAVFLQEHLKRLFHSLKKINLHIEYDSEDLERIIGQVVEINRLDKGSLRLTLTAGEADRVGEGSNILVSCKRGISYGPESYRRGFTAGISRIRRNPYSPLVYIKSVNYLESILARQEAVQNGWDEVLFNNVLGFLTEGSVSNLFIIKNDQVLTPSVECGLLAGITRKKVLEVAANLGYQPVEGCLTSYDLLSAREAFLTNSLMGVMSLVKLGAVAIGNGKPGPVTDRIAKAYAYRYLVEDPVVEHPDL